MVVSSGNDKRWRFAHSCKDSQWNVLQMCFVVREDLIERADNTRKQCQKNMPAIAMKVPLTSQPYIRGRIAH